MSVIIVDIDDRSIYSDTNLSLGSIDMCQIHKSRHLKIGKYKVLMGGIGTPSVIDMLMAFAIKDIELIPDHVEIGAYPSFTSLHNNPEIFTDRINAISHVQKNDELDSDILIAVEDMNTNSFHVGMMITHNPIVAWGLFAPHGDTTICLGNSQVISAWRTTNGCILQRISNLYKTIQFLKRPNAVERISIDGNRTLVDIDVDNLNVKKGGEC